MNGVGLEAAEKIRDTQRVPIAYPILHADEAAALMATGSVIACGGFTPAGAPKAITRALAQRARREHAAGRRFDVSIISGSSTGPSVDGELARADALAFRAPYQASADVRAAINSGRTRFIDMDLSEVPRAARRGIFGTIAWAILEASSIATDGSGEIVLTSGVGAAQTYARLAGRVLIELNARHPAGLRGIHDIAELADPPDAQPVAIAAPSDRIGQAVVRIDPAKIAGVVATELDDEMYPFEEPSALNLKIGQNTADFIAGELRRGAIPAAMLPVQAGIGDVANAVLLALGAQRSIPDFSMYAEVIQSTALRLIRDGRVRFASGSALTVAPSVLREVYAELAFFRPRIVLRPQELSNCGEVIRRLGVIAINTALEFDLFGNVNSTHTLGRNIVNGIGGSGDFARNAHLSIFTCPSTARDQCISRIVPMVSYTEHTEHAVHVVVTEHGVADLRGKCPRDRAAAIIEHCAHPDYRPLLRDYVKLSAQGPGGQTPHTLHAAFAFHEAFRSSGDMRKARFV